MLNKIFIKSLILLSLSFLIFSCSEADKLDNFLELNKNVGSISSSEKELHFAKTSRAGVMTGTYGEIFVDTELKNKNLYNYDSLGDAVPALNSKKVDYVIASYSNLIIVEKANDNLIILPTIFTKDGNSVAFKKGNVELREKFDKVINKFLEDGTIDNIADRWFKKGDHNMPKTEFNPNAPVLRVGISANRAPQCYVHNSTIVGFDIEILERIVKELNMRVEYVEMKFASLAPALVTSKVDAIISNITRTKERERIVDFSKIYFYSPQAIMVHKDTYHKIFDTSESYIAKSESFWASLKGSFYGTFISDNRYQRILRGLGVTLLISTAATLLGLLIGFILCIISFSKRKFCYIPVNVYIATMQAIPMLVLLMILYYIVFASIDINAIIVAIVAFAMNFGANGTEIMRKGVNSINQAQIDAGYSMGYTKLQVFKDIIFPQASRHSIPALRREFTNTVKMTSVVGYIAIQDLTRVSDIIRGRTYEAFFPLISTALIYFILVYMLTLILRKLERKLDPKSRKRTLRKVVL